MSSYIFISFWEAFKKYCAYLEDIRSPFNVGRCSVLRNRLALKNCFFRRSAPARATRARNGAPPAALTAALGTVGSARLRCRRWTAFRGRRGPAGVCPGNRGTPLGKFSPAGAVDRRIGGTRHQPTGAVRGRRLFGQGVPCCGADSLNVSAAFGIVMQAWAYCLYGPFDVQ
jgi:hypothetical protein